MKQNLKLDNQLGSLLDGGSYMLLPNDTLDISIKRVRNDALMGQGKKAQFYTSSDHVARLFHNMGYIID